MVFYFSATGNSKHVAEAIAAATDDETVAIAKCMDEGRFSFDAMGGQVGLVTPVFFWGLPSIVSRFLEHLTVRDAGYAFYVATFGSTTGASGHMAKARLLKCGVRLDAQYCVRMPDTWTPLFDLSDPVKLEATDRRAERQIAEVVDLVGKRSEKPRMGWRIPFPVAYAVYAAYAVSARTSHLSVDDGCIGCGLCARKCPVHAIEIRDGRPVWVKNRCVMCLGCLHRCPTFAIQYGHMTEAHGQYANPHTKV